MVYTNVRAMNRERWRLLAKLARWLGLPVMLWVFTCTLLGDEASASYRTPHPFAQIWGRVVGLSLVGAASLLILYTLSFRRQRLHEASSKWMLFTGICLLPLPV